MSEAVKRIELEINEKDTENLYVLGLHLEELGDLDGAILLYRFGFHFNDVMCITRLADLLSDPPLYRDVGTAELLYKRACIAGYHVACANLAIMYKQLGKTHLSQKYMKMAKDRGDPWDDEDDA